MDLFDHVTEKAEIWIRDMMQELGTDDPRQAYHALGACLQALRDRLRVDEAAQLAAQLPLLVRGMFFEGWHPASTPLRIRRPDEMLAAIDEREGAARRVDPQRALSATFQVLRRHVSPGEMESLAHVLPSKFAEIAG
jgi:uncharacterized protein (DUF2267 family)